MLFDQVSYWWNLKIMFSHLEVVDLWMKIVLMHVTKFSPKWWLALYCTSLIYREQDSWFSGSECHFERGYYFSGLTSSSLWACYAAKCSILKHVSKPVHINFPIHALSKLLLYAMYSCVLQGLGRFHGLRSLSNPPCLMTRWSRNPRPSLMSSSTSGTSLWVAFLLQAWDFEIPEKEKT